MLSTANKTQFKYKYTDWLKVKGWKKDILSRY